MAVDPFKSNKNHGTQATDAKAAVINATGVFVGYPYEATVVPAAPAAVLSGSNDLTYGLVNGARVPVLKGSPTWTNITALSGTTPVRLTRCNYAFMKVDAGTAVLHTAELNTAAGNVTPVP